MVTVIIRQQHTCVNPSWHRKAFMEYALGSRGPPRALMSLAPGLSADDTGLANGGARGETPIATAVSMRLPGSPKDVLLRVSTPFEHHASR
jgi:hypothetical protein